MMKKLLYTFQGFTIRKKLNASYLPLSMFFILILGISSFLIYKNSITERTLKSMEDNSDLIINGIEKLINDGENCADMLTININEVYEREEYFLKDVNPTRQFNLISGALTNAEIIFKGLDSIAFSDTKGNLYYSQILMRENSHLIETSPYMTELQYTRGKNIWFDMTKRPFLITDADKPVLTLGKKIISIRTGETLGYLFINIEEEMISQVFADQIIDYKIINKENFILASSDNKQIFDVFPLVITKSLEKAAGLISFENKTYAVTSHDIEILDWQLMGMGLLDEMARDVWRIGLIILILILALITVLIFINNIISLLITNPIRDLQKGLEKIGQGSFDYRFHNTRQNELGSISRTFNRMSQRISDLLKKIEWEENQKREYELALIQEQIKPHFLYNTLDIILKLSQMKQYRRAERTIVRLADYYKKSLSGGEEIISIDEELQITKDYLELQKIRYADLFTYDFQIDNAILHCPIPKLTLQPLVENSIYHGLKYSEKEGLIQIKGTIESDRSITLRICDNGAGLEKEQFLKMISSDEGENGHFGLRNVHHRLQLYFGDSCGIEAENEMGEYTELIIHLPGREK